MILEHFKLVHDMIFICVCCTSYKTLFSHAAFTLPLQVPDPTCYEEMPAIPQPAFVFAGLSMTLANTALTESLPDYQADDPYKIDQPPPSYIDICDSRLTNQELQSFAELATEDTQRLIDNEDQCSDVSE